MQSIRNLPPRRAAEAPGVDTCESGARKVVAEAGVEFEAEAGVEGKWSSSVVTEESAP